MNNYRDFLPELKSTTLFQGIDDDDLIALLEAMQPEILCRKAGDTNTPKMDFDKGFFRVILKGLPLDQLAPRPDRYNMPKMGEPGMMMGEIPSLSEMFFGKPKKKPSPPNKKRRRGKKPFGPRALDFDLYTLEMSGDMVTKYYNPEVTAAQSKMLRNFLGILAQKVTDVRKEKAEIANELEAEKDKHSLHIFSAGVAMRPVREAIERWNELHPELPAVMYPGGSVDLICNAIGGELCDVLISADDTIIQSMLMPKHAEGYYVFAGNKMVIVGDDITSENWKEKLLAPDAVFMHMNPYGDPGGYRAVMALLLADDVEPGLAEKLMNHPGHIGMEKPGDKPRPDAGKGSSERPEGYRFGYYSGPASQGKPFADLPDSMNLSREDMADAYAKVQFAVDDENTVTAAPINHAVTILKNAPHKEEAAEFVKLFLEADFESMSFLPRSKKVGNWPL